ncbi:sensor histidine kinase [Urbifossiella limnaea]|uniref:histidine kinase n=1 Tax=Urbifossiella limnaea TaxID=2528023 RepID=A0A517XUS0_9BACT|nr:ATP-binding protein [Urbifossiella limnaea]QDU21248.1 Phytochrome-like protein cph1 [Urbifossiella limnaea]
MGEFWSKLFDPEGFVPRMACGNWTPELVWLHVGSDLAIWVAYLSIPLVLVSLLRRKREVPFSWLFVLFALFILSCGFTHLGDALMFHYPAYRAQGVMKLVTAIVSWATVCALVPAVPQLDELIRRVSGKSSGATNAHAPLAARRGWIWDYVFAAVAGVAAIFMRAALDPLLGTDHAFVLAILAVVYVSWQSGFGPAVATLLISMSGIVYFYVHPRDSFVVQRVSDQVALAAFGFCGVGCAALGHAQRVAHRKARAALADALAREQALGVEMGRRAVAETALGVSEARFRTLADFVPQIVWVTRPDGYHEYYNRRWYDYTGVPFGSTDGEGWNGVFHADDQPRARDRWRQSLATGEPYEIEYRLRRADGAYRWFLGQALPERNSAGAVVRWFGTCTDIDDQKREAEVLERLVADRTAELMQANAALLAEVEERRRVEERESAAARELRRSNAELEQFAYVASHDLQEPLRKIQAFGDLLVTKYGPGLPNEGQGYVTKMKASAGRMSRLIDDLLSYSRVTTHAKPFTRVSLAATVADVVDDLELRAEKVGGRVEVGVLPEVMGDPSQMRQLFQNLIGNALKFHRPGVPPVVRVAAERDGVNWVVTVSDNGIGFEDRHAARIFQVFQRLHGRDEYEGTGVGLAICRKIVDRHGGTITARGRPDGGATFVVTLPAPAPTAPGQ